jgi:radical SAM superfamily enzyme YgiQ (UPF0313 family)
VLKILLLEPPKPALSIGGEDVFIFEPLALEYIAAGVADDHQVRIADLRLERDLEGIFRDFKPDVVGITAFTVHVNVVKKIFDQIRKWDPKVRTVVGGHHATVKPEDFLSPSIDLIVAGEGVFSFREIVRRLEGRESLAGTPGVAVMTDGIPAPAAPGPEVDLDALPFPRRDLTARYRKRYYSDWMKPLASIRTSKGCPHRCNFCAQWKVAGGRYYKRDPRKIVEELAGIHEEFVFFADDESLVDTARMTALALLIRDAGIRKRYFLYGRSDTIARNPELLALWRDIGLERVFVGLEFLKEEDLKYIRKGSSSTDNEKAVEILHALGIDVYASFIVRQEFDEADFAALRAYCRRLGLNFASFAVLTPLPGTDLYDEVKDRLITYNYDTIDFIHTQLPTALPMRKFYSEFHDLYTKAIPMGRQLALLRKYPLREIPGMLAKARRIYKRMKTIHLDYESLTAAGKNRGCIPTIEK